MRRIDISNMPNSLLTQLRSASLFFQPFTINFSPDGVYRSMSLAGPILTIEADHVPRSATFREIISIINPPCFGAGELIEFGQGSSFHTVLERVLHPDGLNLHPQMHVHYLFGEVISPDALQCILNAINALPTNDAAQRSITALRYLMQALPMLRVGYRDLNVEVNRDNPVVQDLLARSRLTNVTYLAHLQGEDIAEIGVQYAEYLQRHDRAVAQFSSAVTSIQDCQKDVFCQHSRTFDVAKSAYSGLCSSFFNSSAMALFDRFSRDMLGLSAKNSRRLIASVRVATALCAEDVPGAVAYAGMGLFAEASEYVGRAAPSVAVLVGFCTLSIGLMQDSDEFGWLLSVVMMYGRILSAAIGYQVGESLANTTIAP